MKHFFTYHNAKIATQGVIGVSGSLAGLAIQTVAVAEILAKLMHCKNTMNYDPLINELIQTLGACVVFLPLIAITSSDYRPTSTAQWLIYGFLTVELLVIINTLNEMGLGECIAERWSPSGPK
jgi:hypothetical protein